MHGSYVWGGTGSVVKEVATGPSSMLKVFLMVNPLPSANFPSPSSFISYFLFELAAAAFQTLHAILFTTECCDG